MFTLERGSRKVKPIRYQLDTGTEVSVLPESTYLSLFSEKKLVKSAAVLKTYTGESIPVVRDRS